MKVQYKYEWFEKNCDKFDEWFDADRFDWYWSNWLAKYCSQHFDKWFDPDDFNWDGSHWLAKFCSQHFDKWFDADRFNWDGGDWLAKYCMAHLDTWYDSKRFAESKEQLIWEHLASKMEGHLNEN